jgi:hypothetical protein
LRLLSRLLRCKGVTAQGGLQHPSARDQWLAQWLQGVTAQGGLQHRRAKSFHRSQQRNGQTNDSQAIDLQSSRPVLIEQLDGRGNRDLERLLRRCIMEDGSRGGTASVASVAFCGLNISPPVRVGTCWLGPGMQPLCNSAVEAI